MISKAMPASGTQVGRIVGDQLVVSGVTPERHSLTTKSIFQIIGQDEDCTLIFEERHRNKRVPSGYMV